MTSRGDPPVTPTVVVKGIDPVCEPCGAEVQRGQPLDVDRRCPRCGAQYASHRRRCTVCPPDVPPTMERAGVGPGVTYWMCPRCGWVVKTVAVAEHDEPDLFGGDR